MEKSATSTWLYYGIKVNYMEDFNYIDNLNSTANIQYAAEQHDKGIQLQGRKTYIFPLDKTATELSEVYQEETHGRVYLPHFIQRGLYKTTMFTARLSADNYTESEESFDIEYDFARMVHNIHNLKQTSVGVLSITNNAKIPLTIEISDKFRVRNNSELLFEKDLNMSVWSFINQINSECKLVCLSYTGDSEDLSFSDKILFKILPRRVEKINLNNSIYKNISDIIDTGFVIMTDKYKLYQVVGAYPRNDNYSQYIAWNVRVELMNLAKANLPNDFDQLMKENQYGLIKTDI